MSPLSLNFNTNTKNTCLCLKCDHEHNIEKMTEPLYEGGIWVLRARLKGDDL